jgi:hypothetical protein
LAAIAVRGLYSTDVSGFGKGGTLSMGVPASCGGGRGGDMSVQDGLIELASVRKLDIRWAVNRLCLNISDNYIRHVA